MKAYEETDETLVAAPEHMAAYEPDLDLDSLGSEIGVNYRPVDPGEITPLNRLGEHYLDPDGNSIFVAPEDHPLSRVAETEKDD